MVKYEKEMDIEQLQGDELNYAEDVST